jgi:type I restriction enzyme S subunit
MSEWKEIPIGKCIDLISGYAFKSTNFLSEQSENSLPVIKIKNVANGDVNIDNVVYHEVSNDLEKFRISRGDVLIAMTGNHPQAQTQVVGDVSKYKLNSDSLLNQRVGKFVVKGNTCLDFIYYLFKSEDVKSYLANQSSGSANQANISKGDILGLIMTVPEPEEQTAIASVLSSLDDKIDLLHRQNQTLEKMAETLFRQWFVEESKEEWVEGKLGDEFYIVMGASPPGESYNEEGSGVPMYQGNADFGFRFPTNRVFTTDPKRFAEKHDALISVRAPVGEQNMANEMCCIGRGVAAFRYKGNSTFYSYTYYKIMSLMNEIKQFNETGTVFGSISRSDFENINISIADESVIAKFQNQAKQLDDKIINNTEKIRTLTSMRDNLLPKLMSGEVRVEF